MEYYLAVKRNKLLIHVSTWMTTSEIILSEGNQSQKDTSRIIQFMQHSLNDVFIVVKIRLVAARGQACEGAKTLSVSIRSSIKRSCGDSQPSRLWGGKEEATQVVKWHSAICTNTQSFIHTNECVFYWRICMDSTVCANISFLV